MTDIETRVRQIVADVTHQDVSSLGVDDDLVERLGIDSLQGLQMLASVEKRCEVRLADEELITLRTISKIVAAVERGRSEAVVARDFSRAVPDNAELKFRATSARTS